MAVPSTAMTPRTSLFARWRRLLLVCIALSLSLSLLGLANAPQAYAAPHSQKMALPDHLAACPQHPIQGQRVYDCAGALTAGEIATLEHHAAAVAQAGAPTIVYLQAQNASYDQTLQDAANLMQRWDVESHPGARDGFVMFLNLIPGNLLHGEIALYAGQTQLDGSLSQSELSRIFSDVMLPDLQNGQLAQGISDGLDAVANDLRYGPPSSQPSTQSTTAPDPGQQAMQTFGRIPFNVLALLYLLIAVGAAWVIRLRLNNKPFLGKSTSAPPSDLAPAYVGAIVNGRVSDDLIEATIFDFARRGLLAIEPAGGKDSTDADVGAVQIRLLKSSPQLDQFEASVWRSLVAAKTARNIITTHSLPQVTTNWYLTRATLRSVLIQQGLYTPAARRDRDLLYLIGSVGLIFMFMGFVVALIAQEGWALLGMLVCAITGISLITTGHGIPDTSHDGEILAAPWRSYRDYLLTGELSNAKEELDRALPYAIALHITETITLALQQAGEQGYSPAWFHPAPAETAKHAGAAPVSFYPYWLGWHACLYPPPPVSATPGRYSGYVPVGGFSGGGFGGGAAAGGGGAGGAF